MEDNWARHSSFRGMSGNVIGNCLRILALSFKRAFTKVFPVVASKPRRVGEVYLVKEKSRGEMKVVEQLDEDSYRYLSEREILTKLIVMEETLRKQSETVRNREFKGEMFLYRRNLLLITVKKFVKSNHYASK